MDRALGKGSDHQRKFATGRPRCLGSEEWADLCQLKVAEVAERKTFLITSLNTTWIIRERIRGDVVIQLRAEVDR